MSVYAPYKPNRDSYLMHITVIIKPNVQMWKTVLKFVAFPSLPAATASAKQQRIINKDMINSFEEAQAPSGQ